MIVFLRGNEQDTLKINQAPAEDSVRKINDPVLKQIGAQDTSYFSVADSAAKKTDRSEVPVSIRKASITISTDTTSVCSRNAISDVTFFDPGNFLKRIELPGADKTLFSLAEKTRIRQSESREFLVRHLRNGESLPGSQFQTDWILLVLITSAILLAVVRNASKRFQSLIRFFLFRGINDPVSRDTGGIFHWQSTILNLISFFIISLFCYLIALHNEMIPDGFSGITFWAICMAVVILALTLRHAVCIITGNLSGQKDVFDEYLVGIYQSYHFSALLLFILIVFILYTSLLPPGVFLNIGFAIFALIYLFRVIRLMIIFMNRNISLFYLILYLCALEILPVAIAIRYFSGTFQIG